MFTKRIITRFVFTILIVAALFFTSLGITPAYAAGITVNTDVDESTTNGKCSLREAIINANNNSSTRPDCATGFGIDTITFAGNYTITLAGAQLPSVTSEIVINGNGAGNTIIQANANPNTATYRVFMVSGGAGNLTLDSLTVRHGRCNGSCEGAPNEGGGIYNYDSSLTVTNSTISGNRAQENGGGISSRLGSLAITNSTISGNRAEYSGGGIYNGDTPLTVTNSTFSGNSAGTNGGGIYNNDSVMTVTNSTFSGNSATSGGGIHNDDTMSVADSTFSGNSASNNGGGICHTHGTLTVTDSTLSGNTAAYDGGGIHTYGTLTVTNSTLSGNSAEYGGAISNQGSLSIWSSTLHGNSAGTGGGIYNGSAMGIVNSTLSDNEADDNGGAIFNEGYDARIYNSTIVFNTLSAGTADDAAGIYAALSVSLYNSLVAGNNVAPGIYRDCSGTVFLGGINVLWDQTNCTRSASSTGYFGSLFSLNELGPLQDNGGPTWTHALIPIEGYRAIDAGDNTVCSNWPINNLDQRGVTRPQGSHCDVGAYEYRELIATFGDVPTSHWAWMFVQRLANAGITGGCGGGNYCPEASVTRAQMAVFLLRGIHGSSYTPPVVGSSTGFGDVSTSHWAAAWIKQLAAEGITGGCGSGNYCPDDSVTRAQMSIFLLRSKYGPSYTPPAVGGSTDFGDVAPAYWAAAWIKQLVAEGITAGCGNGNYCPESAVTRAQMAVFLVKTFNLP